MLQVAITPKHQQQLTKHSSSCCVMWEESLPAMCLPPHHSCPPPPLPPSQWCVQVLSGEQPHSRASDMYSLGVLVGEVLFGVRLASPRDVAVRSGGEDNDAIMNALAPLLDGTAVERPSAAMLLLMPLFQVLPPLLTCSICMEEEPEQQVPAIPPFSSPLCAPPS